MKKIILLLSILLHFSAQAFTLISSDPEQEGWSGNSISFKINKTNCPSNIDEIMEKAAKVWNGVPWSRLKVEVGGESSAAVANLIAGAAGDVPLIVCDTNFGATTGADEDFVVGIGFIANGTRPIVYGGVVLNVEAGADGNISNFSTEKAAIIVAHEMGHALGIGHSEEISSLMYFDGSYKQSLSLSHDDIQAILYLYPRDEWSTKQLGGCGTVNSGGLLLLFPLLFAIFLYRRASKLLLNTGA